MTTDLEQIAGGILIGLGIGIFLMWLLAWAIQRDPSSWWPRR